MPYLTSRLSTLEILRMYSDLINEISIRMVLWFIFFVVHVEVPPYERDLTQSELFEGYRKPHYDSYIPSKIMMCIIIFVPLAVMLIPLQYRTLTNDVDAFQAFLAWTLALSLNAVATEVTKVIVGRPRPDFFYRCYPDGYATSYTSYGSVRSSSLGCTGHPQTLREGRKSFPSGHSSFAFCSFGFLSLWLCGRLCVFTNRSPLMKLCCFLPMVLATVIAVSRYVDNHHHWDDIAAGSLLGMLIAYFCYRYYYNPVTSVYAGIPLIMTNENSGYML